MKIKKLSDFEESVIFSFLVMLSVLVIAKSPADSAFIRLIIMTIISATTYFFKNKEEIRETKLIFQILIMCLLIMNRLKTCGDIIMGTNVYEIPELPMADKYSLGIFLSGVLLVIGAYFYLYFLLIKNERHYKKYEHKESPDATKFDSSLFLIMIIFFVLLHVTSAFIRPVYDYCITKKIDLVNIQNYLCITTFDGLFSLISLMVFYISILKDTRPAAYESGNFLITEDYTIVKYKGKQRKIYVPKNLTVYLSDTFSDCDSSYEIWFEEGTTELPPLKFKKSVPEIYYPSTLQNLREYSVFIKGQNPFDNSLTAKMLLNNPVFKIIDGCMVNTKTNTLLFVTDHSKNEFKIPDCVCNISQYAFDDLLLGKGYKLRKHPDFDVNSYSYLLDKYNNFSNGNDKEYLLHEAETVISRTQLEKIILHKNIKSIDSDAFELATGLREVYVPEDADYDLAEMISTRPYIKYLGKGKKITHRMIERLLQIHAKIKSGCYPNSKQLAYDLETSEPTINRDIEYLRDSHDAPIEYDYTNRGYYYTRDYELKF